MGDILEDKHNPMLNDSLNMLPVESPTSPSAPQSANITLTKQTVHVPCSSALWKRKAKSDQISKKHVPCKAAPSKAQKGKRKHATSVIESDAADSDHESSSSSSSSSEETSSDESKNTLQLSRQ